LFGGDELDPSMILVGLCNFDLKFDISLANKGQPSAYYDL
jgi:hypothetical protein